MFKPHECELALEFLPEVSKLLEWQTTFLGNQNINNINFNIIALCPKSNPNIKNSAPPLLNLLLNV